MVFILYKIVCLSEVVQPTKKQVNAALSILMEHTNKKENVLEGISTNANNGKIADTTVTRKTGHNTDLVKVKKDNPIIGLTIIKRTKSVTNVTIIETNIVVSANPPIFNTKYAMGTVDNANVPIVSIYFFIFPVARTALIIVPEITSTKEKIKTSLTNDTVCSGTSFSQMLNIVSVSNNIGSTKIKSR